jgi:hypothetical protein
MSAVSIHGKKANPTISKIKKMSYICPIKKAHKVNTTAQRNDGLSPTHGSADDVAMAE